MCPPGRALETRLQALEAQHQAQLNSLQEKREQLHSLLGHQTGTLANLKHNLHALSSNSSSLQQQQQQLTEFVQRLVRIVAQDQHPGEQEGVSMGWGGEPKMEGRPCVASSAIAVQGPIVGKASSLLPFAKEKLNEQ
jgi:hypothetical protein